MTVTKSTTISTVEITTRDGGGFIRVVTVDGKVTLSVTGRMRELHRGCSTGAVDIDLDPPAAAELVSALSYAPRRRTAQDVLEDGFIPFDDPDVRAK